MSTVLQLRCQLAQPPAMVVLPGVAVRTYAGPEDIDRWLEIRHRAFAREKHGVRQWGREDFEAEFLAKPWWRPEHLWFAEALDSPGQPVGTVTMAMRGEGKPVVHWLAVMPRWRRRGIARLLVTALHTTCWAEGHREIWLETHAAWIAAAQFYESLGYEPA